MASLIRNLLHIEKSETSQHDYCRRLASLTWLLNIAVTCSADPIRPAVILGPASLTWVRRLCG